MINYQEKLKAAIQFINSYDDFLIVSHVNPDGDTISSSLAMAKILNILGKNINWLIKIQYLQNLIICHYVKI